MGDENLAFAALSLTSQQESTQALPGSKFTRIQGEQKLSVDVADDGTIVGVNAAK